MNGVSERTPLPHAVQVNIAIVNAVATVGEVGRGLVLPVIYLLITDALNQAKSMIGPVIAAFSFGRLGSSVVLGWMADNSSLKQVYLVGLVLNVLGAVLFIASSHFANTGSDEPQQLGCLLLFSGRILSGMGSGTLSCAREDIRTLTRKHLHERTAQFATLSVSQFAGFALSPVLVVMLPSPAPGSTIAGIRYDQYTQVGGLLVLMNVAVAVLIARFYERDPLALAVVADDKELGTPLDAAQSFPPTPPEADMPPLARGRVQSRDRVQSLVSQPSDVASPRSFSLPDEMEEGTLRTVGLYLFLALNFTGRGALALMEALTGRMFIATFPRNDAGDVIGGSGAVMGVDEQARRTSWFFTALGAVGTLSYMVCIWASRKGLNEVVTLVYGFASMGVGGIVLALCVQTDATGHLTVPGGVFCLALGSGLVWSVGSPVSQLSTLAAFGKVLGKKAKSAAEMGMLGSAGSCGRMLLPCLQLVITQVELQFWLTAIVCLCCCAPVVIFSLRGSQQRPMPTSSAVFPFVSPPVGNRPDAWRSTPVSERTPVAGNLGPTYRTVP
eukprot:TRINITY_DN1170_c0_g1_i1.p1 TRINITY_DN1170_c0_g1~~TRINITY_DN1170_c0_g1_i1.p1  ORF type:complete len:556 (+),score=148.92 TRINITY_DN1170_c0_g1_i1:82-1749(+)